MGVAVEGVVVGDGEALHCVTTDVAVGKMEVVPDVMVVVLDEMAVVQNATIAVPFVAKPCDSGRCVA